VLLKEAAQPSFGIEMKQLIEIFPINQHRMPAVSLVFRLHERRATLPFVHNQFDSIARNCRTISRRDQDGASLFADLSHAQLD